MMYLQETTNKIENNNNLANLPSRQKESVFASIRQLYRVAVLDVGSSLGPVVTAPTCRVEHLGCRPDLVTHTVIEASQGAVSNVPDPLQVLPVLGVELVVAPGVEEVLAVTVEGEVQLEVF